MKPDTDAITRLREVLKPGDTLFTILRNVSRSGMRREISIIKLVSADDYRIWDHAIARALGCSLGDRGVHIRGGGMDMGFEIVYQLGQALFPDGFGVSGTTPNGRKVRPKTKAEAATLVAKGAKFRDRNGDPSGWDNDGGYALNQRWL